MFDIKRGIDVLRHYVKNAPDSPGVYRMLNDNDEVLYVGKAKSIKKRIVSYTQVEKLSTRLQKMVAEVCKMEFIIVENENRALIVENELIKKFHPKYNILLKDDKSFMFSLNSNGRYNEMMKFEQKDNFCGGFDLYDKSDDSLFEIFGGLGIKKENDKLHLFSVFLGDFLCWIYKYRKSGRKSNKCSYKYN